MGLNLSMEEVNEILAKYDITITTEKELALIEQISNLPTNAIDSLFNDITINDVFHINMNKELF